MATITIDDLAFHFGRNHAASAYDRWQHYQNVLAKLGLKAVDIVAVPHGREPEVCWLIEVKDFRVLRGTPGEKNTSGLPETVVQKATDSIIGLADAAVNAAVPYERDFVIPATAAPQKRIVLHLEPHRGSSKLFSEAPSARNVLQKMRQIIRHSYPNLDRDPLVLDMVSTPRSGVPWTVSPR